MIANALHCYVSRLRDFGGSLKTAYGHAMPFDALSSEAYGSGGSCINVFVPVTTGAQGSSVPISRGGPLIFNE